MSARTFPGPGSRQSTRFGGTGDYEGPEDEMFPGERVGTPLEARGLSPIARARLLILALAAAGAAMAVSDRGWPEWVTARISELAGARMAGPATAGSEKKSPDDQTTEQRVAEAPPPLPDAVVAEGPETKAHEVAAVPYDERAETAASARLEPPVIDRDDPYQAKALAAGLHPGLSRVLLAKLTAEDYRNAGKAIQVALAETPDDGVLKWPKTPAQGRARFEVHFVTGAVPECRRYVVTIQFGGWSTTALPMERCGDAAQKPKAG